MTLDVALALAFLIGALPLMSLIDRLSGRRSRQGPDARPPSVSTPPAPASTAFVRLVGAGQPWPHDVDGHLAVLDGCWANRLTDVGLVRCGAAPTNIDGLCEGDKATLQQVRDEHARIGSATA